MVKKGLMMKKKISILFMFFASLVIAACASESPNDFYIDDVFVCDDENIVVFEYGSHFIIYQTPALAPWYVSHDIINTNGEVIKSIVSDRPVWISPICDDILKISVTIGHSIPSVVEVQFYSVQRDMFSDVFTTQPFVLKDDVVAHINVLEDNSLGLIVQSMFEPKAVFRELTFDDFTFTGCPHSAISDIQYLDSGDINVLYTANVGGYIVEKSIVLVLQW